MISEEDCKDHLFLMGDNCTKCGIHVSTPLKKEIDELKAMLKKLEWTGYNGYGGCEECPICGEVDVHTTQNGTFGGHTDDCELARLIK